MRRNLAAIAELDLPMNHPLSHNVLPACTSRRYQDQNETRSFRHDGTTPVARST
jgi:hypothetical protein